MLLLDVKSDLKIGFPPPLLGEQPMRLPVALAGEGLLAMALPGGILSEAHPFYPGRASVIAGLQKQLQAAKPELERFGMECALAVNFVEPEVSGLLLVGVARAGVEHWRNVFGSQQLAFVYEFVAAARPDLPDEVVCALPIARHRERDIMLVSHKTGKKSQTRFSRVAERGAFALWRAEMSLPRVHQLRLHAVEVGLAIPGERLYGEQPALTWSALKGKSEPGRGAGGVICGRPLVHLAEIDGPEGFAPVRAAPAGRLARLWAELGR